MPLELKIISDHADLLGEDAVREFFDSGGTIGRSLHNDWILPDPDRYISGRHATIDFRGGIYYLADVSSNGVYVNNEMEPVGRGNPRRLFDGDRLRLGDFEMRVSVDAGESLVVPLDEDDDTSVAPDSIDQFVDEVSLVTGVKMLDEEEITGDEEFQSALFGGPSQNDEAAPEPKRDASPSAKAAPSKSIDVTAEDLFDSFLDGLGINRVELHPSVNRPEMMSSAGQALREFVMGTTDLLTARSNLKNTFRLDQTTVLPRHNNPMKLSENTNDLLKQLLIGGEGEYLGARDSIREVCRDLINHQNAFLDAMNSAFIDFAERFDPDELRDEFDQAVGKSLFGFANRMKYWQLYCDLYPIITEKGSGRFPQMFGEEFVRAYERQVAEYQRHDRDGMVATATNDGDDSALMETQKFDQPTAATESAFEDDDIVDVLGDSNLAEIDQSFIDELDQSLNDDPPHDQIKG